MPNYGGGDQNHRSFHFDFIILFRVIEFENSFGNWKITRKIKIKTLYLTIFLKDWLFPVDLIPFDNKLLKNYCNFINNFSYIFFFLSRWVLSLYLSAQLPWRDDSVNKFQSLWFLKLFPKSGGWVYAMMDGNGIKKVDLLWFIECNWGLWFKVAQGIGYSWDLQEVLGIFSDERKLLPQIFHRKYKLLILCFR